MTAIHQLPLFDQMPMERQEAYLDFLVARHGWPLERAEMELRGMNHIGLWHIGMEIKLISAKSHVVEHDPFAAVWSA